MHPERQGETERNSPGAKRSALQGLQLVGRSSARVTTAQRPTGGATDRISRARTARLAVGGITDRGPTWQETLLRPCDATAQGLCSAPPRETTVGTRADRGRGDKAIKGPPPVTSSPVGPPDELNAGDQERTSSGRRWAVPPKGPGPASKRRRKCGEEAAELSGEDAGFFFPEVLDRTFAQSYRQEDGHGIKLAAYALHRHRNRGTRGDMERCVDVARRRRPPQAVRGAAGNRCTTIRWVQVGWRSGP